MKKFSFKALKEKINIATNSNQETIRDLNPKQMELIKGGTDNCPGRSIGTTWCGTRHGN